MGSDIFISATQARQNAIADRIVHTEGRLIEDAILDASKYGLFSTVVSSGTPMTQSNTTPYTVTYYDPNYNIFQIPGHPYGTGSVVNISSSGMLPDPFSASSKYYVTLACSLRKQILLPNRLPLSFFLLPGYIQAGSSATAR